MNRQIPVSSRICFYHQIKRAWDIHQDKITHQAPMVDCQQPSTMVLKNNLTFKGLSTNRRDEIERQNNFLLKKLLDINQTSQFRINPKSSKTKRCLPNLSQINKSQRQRRLKKIQKQNQFFNTRLSYNASSNYSIKALSSSRQKNQNYLQLISRYPSKNNNNKTKTNIKFQMKNSPHKYNSKFNRYSSERYQTYQNMQTQTAEITSVLNGIKYRIRGQYHNNGLDIIIRNPLVATDKHTLQVDQKQSKKLYKQIFCGNLRSILESVSFDSKHNQFFLKLPNSNEF